jgi:hypothetical protein
MENFVDMMWLTVLAVGEAGETLITAYRLPFSVQSDHEFITIAKLI